MKTGLWQASLGHEAEGKATTLTLSSPETSGFCSSWILFSLILLLKKRRTEVLFTDECSGKMKEVPPPSPPAQRLRRGGGRGGRPGTWGPEARRTAPRWVGLWPHESQAELEKPAIQNGVRHRRRAPRKAKGTGRCEPAR